MSFVITLYVREGIVMASDSRLTLTTTRPEGEKQFVQVAVGQSDSAYKTFLTPKNTGISTYGDASVEGVPIAGYIESFIADELKDEQVDKVPHKLIDYFKKLPKPPNAQFLVAGYKIEKGKDPEQQVWRASIASGRIERANQVGQQGASWGGEADILSRLVQRVGTLDSSGKLQGELPYHQIPFGFFNLQDAIDYAKYAVQVTIDSFRFQPRAKTVGGPVDILVIKPTNAVWITHKELHA